ncbi:hypothetical protein F5Y04DRAFT_274359 [Hypomontagnella monticulosa]|nr:hypothetical protein F5Y04DRAFT_274359 [Hypomontagnella monticulosa]
MAAQKIFTIWAVVPCGLPISEARAFFLQGSRQAHPRTIPSDPRAKPADACLAVATGVTIRVEDQRANRAVVYSISEAVNARLARKRAIQLTLYNDRWTGGGGIIAGGTAYIYRRM